MYLLQYLPWYILILIGLFIMIYTPYWVKYHSKSLTKQQKLMSSGLGIILGVSIIKMNLIEGLIIFNVINAHENLSENEAVDSVIFSLIIILTILLLITVFLKVISCEQSVYGKIKKGALFILAIIALIWMGILKLCFI